MPGELRIRPLRAADRTAWLELWQGYLEFYETVLDPLVTDVVFARLAGGSPDLAGIVAATADDTPIGFAHVVFHPSTWSARSYCYLEDLFVAPTARRTGAGRALIEAAYAEADRRRADRVYWLTAAGNATARALYDQVGAVTPFVVYHR